MAKLSKDERRQKIIEIIEDNPFITDIELCELFSVSIQTIRLDRNQLQIPEVRKRVSLVAKDSYDEIRSIEAHDIIGDVFKVEPNHQAESRMTIKAQHVFERNQISRGHVIFAQANSLCVALIHKDSVLTHESKVTFHKPVYLNESVHAIAKVNRVTPKYFEISVNSYVKDKHVFSGEFKMYYISEDE
ncbi:transcription factor FapR [Staphylococcus massiliensis]|uniref:Fatty acid biosynthesis transcriptional regulator n=1 Tax=Staphylococcus massiliensis S46 TaxID=1229783 RepID=K9B9M8_9STAP|nr:transcription factor FapR [Staphylococcus massiliensis]EKU50435.1 fatty acid biosynthesis transcriptional regulator [Staphylococcus massiliensis S46]POA00490.1 transcription factor FapR [Staphylococcus massiliensis CCUG 55927]